MAIPNEHARRRIYHFTHIYNLPRILTHGFLAKNEDEFPADDHLSVAEMAIQNRRATMAVTCGTRGVVHDYVPLYFGALSPMLLAVVNKKNVDQRDIIYFEFPIAILDRDDVVFTDASANTEIPPNFYSDTARMDRLNWNEIDSRKWRSQTDALKHQRMAEVLVHRRLRISDAVRVVVWDSEIQRQVQELAQAVGVRLPPVVIDRFNYFTKFAQGSNDSLVTGPRGTWTAYKQACQQVHQAQRTNDAPFQTLQELLMAIRRDFGSIPETAELVGLESENVVHNRTVDRHTQDVVARLKLLPRFGKLAGRDQDVTELAAYLHDIGKGPKARWADGVQKVDADHPVGAMPMMVNILTMYVRHVSAEDVDLLLKLVCYHDLVGEVLGKGRDERQIVEIARDERELAMLFALGHADASSLVEAWWAESDATRLYERCRVAIKIRGER
jgi:ssDNA thymidine ADP-ribosyltransferase, DarT